MKEQAAKGKDKNRSRIIPAQNASSGTTEAKQQAKTGFDDFHALVNRRAFELYLQRGCRDGHAEEDWIDAEREILDRAFPT